ncbi:metalloregulator ArsR/SmtB family transcription factor [Alkalihalobacillus oceani]|uniref:Metalloregulator ArsR/SmtB family transcription factor n=1 Tax=Halalkalibacter oceani TaxID=1653776 RepID=A0A9X2DUP1_9BACI|nr:metalloregulator ArsR/SmtB family transcription factor [Halalkalibacter oceani]MCM3715857.1 metalloregulator ArsR/SmtB family transcription factor [Halalkalibacter oceani]
MKTTKTTNNNDQCEIFCYDKEKVNKLSLKIESEEFTSTADIFKALSDETRLKIAYTLTQENELCVCDVAIIIGTTNATASHHLRHLRNLRIAKSRKEGKLVFYSLDDPHVTSLIINAMVHSQEDYHV